MSVIFQRAVAEWKSRRADYQDVIEAQYSRAETATNGMLLNARGRAKGVDPMSLFSGPAVRAHAYASEELIEHWARYPRLTFAEYERQTDELSTDA